MQPVIHPEDTVVVDTATTSFDRVGIYLINVESGQRPKRAIERG